MWLVAGRQYMLINRFLKLTAIKNSNNFGKWSNKTFDQLLQEANVTYANKYEERWKTLQKRINWLRKKHP